MSKDVVQRTSGLRPPPDPPENGDAYDVALFYVKYWEAEFARARLVVKRRASHVVVAVATATALIAVVGAATAVLDWAWLGIVSAALAGFASVVGAWDGLFRHRELWHQRSLVLGHIQMIKRSTELRSAAGEDRTVLAGEAMSELNAVLTEDLNSWSAIRHKNLTSPTQNDHVSPEHVA